MPCHFENFNGNSLEVNVNLWHHSRIGGIISDSYYCKYLSGSILIRSRLLIMVYFLFIYSNSIEILEQWFPNGVACLMGIAEEDRR